MQAQSSSHFYAVSMGKFSLLYFCTQGLYLLYWLYRAWRSQEIEQNRTLFPAVRAVLAPLFIVDLFEFFAKKQKAVGDEFYWPANQLAWLYIATQVLTVAAYFVNFWLFHVVNILGFLVAFYIFYKAQLVVNRLAQDNFGASNKKITFINQMWMFVGAHRWVSLVFLIASGPAEELPIEGIEGQASEMIEQIPVGDDQNSGNLIR